MLRRQSQGDHSPLAAMHGLSCGLKAWATQTAADGAEDARKLTGGHGYMEICGLQDIVGSVTATATLEGENYVMWQQLASYLVKIRGASSISMPADFAHASAWNKHMMTLVSAARAYTDFYILKCFISNVEAISDHAVHEVMARLCSLFALSTIISPTSHNAISFMQDSYFSFTQLSEIREQVDVLLEELLPNIVLLMDAWNFTDVSLASAIGCYDGNAYERLMSWTRQLPINVKGRNGGGPVEGFEQYLKPCFQSKL